MSKEKKEMLKKVLLIDNDQFNICVTDSFLYACGFSDVTIARDSKEALSQFAKGFDLVLLNVSLKDNLGFEVCKKLRQMPRGKNVPILALAPKGKSMRSRCFKAGVSNVMSGRTSFKGFREALQSVIN
ncbi:MAG: response regulator [Gammaproteobacteria bacterium]|nr:response regulator [Gammaproteobacteria bacterium]